MTNPHGRRLAAAILALTLGTAPGGAASAQSVLKRTPNLSGAWVGEPGVLQFNFVHRFQLLSGTVANTPTFLLAVPLPGRTLVGLHYASSSPVVRGELNEFELLGRWAPLSTDDDGPVDAGVTLAYNREAESLDGEISASVPVGPLTLTGAGRMLSDYRGTGETRWAGGGGFVLELREGLALAGDLMTVTDKADGEHAAWGVGIQTRIPLTPHTFSLQATNVWTETLQGSSARQGRNRTLYGFEFTVPFTLSRYFGGDAPGGDADAAVQPSDAGDVAAEVTMTNQLRFSPDTVRIRAGQTVRWRNTTPLIHTVTADPSRAVSQEDVKLPEGARTFDSGDLQPDRVFEHTFTVPGEYRYFCVPHEAAGMVGSVIVER